MIICARCKTVLKVIKTGIVFVHRRPVPGHRTLYNGDLLSCPNCDTVILARFGKSLEEANDRAGFAKYLNDLRANPGIVVYEEGI